MLLAIGRRPIGGRLPVRASRPRPRSAPAARVLVECKALPRKARTAKRHVTIRKKVRRGGRRPSVVAAVVPPRWGAP